MRRGARVLRAIAVVVALGLGVAAVWLIVTGDAKQTKIGVLLGLWGLLLAAYQVLGVREGPPRDSLDPTQLDTPASADRQGEFEQRLDEILRRQAEIVGAQLADVRAEIAALRAELAETVGGRLERTETPRLIGSDLGVPNEVRHGDEAHGHEVLARILARERAPHR
jgi:hypothetical protein